MRRRTLLLGLGVGLSALALGATKVNARQTYRYAANPGIDPNLQSLDVYGAEPGARRPILAFIHGGGWSIGDKANPAHGQLKAPAFVARDMVFASVNYRLSPAVRHPAHIEDVASAVAWLHEHAARVGGDEDRIVVMGHSAGAHLAALVATDESRLGAHGLKLSILKGAIPMDGAGYDLNQQAPKVEGRVPILGRMYTDAFGADGSLWTDASPVSHVAPGKGIPPFLIPYTVRANARAEAEELAGALQKAGIEAQTLRSPRQNHFQINHDIGKPGDMVTEAIYAAFARWGV